MEILVVDDDPDIRSTVADILVQEGHAAVAVGSAARALELLGSHQGRCVVLLDLSMPGGDGYAAVDAISRLPGGAGRFPVIVMSASAELGRLAANPAVVGQLFKPFELEDLVAKVKRATKLQASGDSRS